MLKRMGAGFWLVAIIAVIIVFSNLGGIPLLDPDEPVYAETPKEMLQFNDFISPRIYGEFWYDKPPMYYWLVALAFKVFGINEFAARFPSALLSVICVLAVYQAGCRLFNRRAGMISALVLVTCIEYIYLSKAAVTDITLTLFLTTALLAFIRRRYYLFYICAGLATVTKGPIGLLFPGGIIFFYLLLTKNFSLIKQMKLPAGIVLYAIFALPWYVAMVQLHGQAFIDTFLGFHNVTRFTSPEHPQLAVWYYFIPVLIIGFFPWTPLLFQAVWSSLTKSREKYKTLLFLNIWVIFIFLFFSISSTKLVSYILPLYPPLALIAGWYIDYLWDNYRNRKRYYSWALLTLLLTGLLLAGAVFGIRTMPELASGLTALAGVLALLLAGAAYCLFKRQAALAIGIKTAAMIAFALILVNVIFPVAAPGYTSIHIARDFRLHYDGASPVYIAKFLRPGFSFYTDIYGTAVTAENITAAVNQSGRAYFVLSQAEYKLLTNYERQKLMTLATSADKLLLLRQ